MKILQVMAGAATGGAETYFLDAMLALDEAGVTQQAVIRGNNPHRVEMLRKRNIPVSITGFNNLWPFPTRRAIRDAIAQFRPDIIQYWMGRAGQFAEPGFEGRSIGWYGGYYKVERFEHCDWHVGVTHDIRRHIVESGVDEAHAATVHTFAEMKTAEPVGRASLDTPEGAPLILALARLHWKKGIDLLLDAMEAVPEAYLWIAGDGPLDAELKAQSAKLGLDNRVRFLGWRNDRAALLAACDIVAFPSRYEPFGTVTPEAWAAGKPLVAAASAGPKAYITHEKDGLLIEVDDLDALRISLRRLVSDADLRARLVAGGTATYEARFTKQAYLRDALAFYDRVARAGRLQVKAS